MACEQKPIQGMYNLRFLTDTEVYMEEGNENYKLSKAVIFFYVAFDALI